MLIGMDDPRLAESLPGHGPVAATAMTYRVDFEPSDDRMAMPPDRESLPEKPPWPEEGSPAAGFDVPVDSGPADEFEARAAMEMEVGAEAIAVGSASETAALPQAAEIASGEFRPSVAPKLGGKRRTEAVRGSGPGRRRVPQILASTLLGVLGAAAGYYGTRYGWVEPLQIHPLVEPIKPVFLGGLLGLLIGWVGLRWTAKQY